MSPHNVLVVDDDPSIRRILRQNLELEGYATTEATDGVEALDAVAASAPDLVVLDVMMPNLDGFTVLERLRGSPDTRDLPVILLTARSSSDDVWEGWNKGVDYYMTKPFDVDELLRFVSYIFSEKKKAAESGDTASEFEE